MCGFIGRVVPAGVGAARPLNVGRSWLARRGPDSQRLWQSPDGGAGRVELLHARLAIVDFTERAHQPLWHRERRVAIVFNGEVYNQGEVRAGLPGFDFTTESDTEVILAAYLTGGLAALDRLKGMFSAAICDVAEQRVHLLRDAVGKKPLFAARWGGQVLFGSSLLPLVAAAGVRPAIDDSAAAYFWRREFPPPDTATLAGARPLPPGTVTTLDFAGNELGTRTLRPRDVAQYDGEDHGEVKVRVEELVEKAVAARLQNNPRPAVLLSGGIDSTVVAQTLARRFAGAPDAVRTFTLGAVVPWTNDERYARYAAHRLHLPLDVLRPHRSSGGLAEQAARYLAMQDEPLGMLSYFSLCRLVAAVRDASRIVMGGDGADEVFLGYGETERWRDPAALPAAGSGMRSGNMHTGPEVPEWASPWARDAMTTALLGHQYAKLDRATAEQGVEARCPFLDWDLMSYVRSLPPPMLLTRGRSKGLLKSLLAGWPDWFVHRRKIGFAYNLRWAWRLSGFSGLRELVDDTAVARFAGDLPAALHGPPHRWNSRDVFAAFPRVWRLACWSAFERRLAEAAGGPTCSTASDLPATVRTSDRRAAEAPARAARRCLPESRVTVHELLAVVRSGGSGECRATKVPPVSAGEPKGSVMARSIGDTETVTGPRIVISQRLRPLSPARGRGGSGEAGRAGRVHHGRLPHARAGAMGAERRIAASTGGRSLPRAGRTGAGRARSCHVGGRAVLPDRQPGPQLAVAGGGTGRSPSSRLPAALLLLRGPRPRPACGGGRAGDLSLPRRVRRGLGRGRTPARVDLSL